MSCIPVRHSSRPPPPEKTRIKVRTVPERPYHAKYAPPVFRVRYEQIVARGKDGKAEPRGGNDGFKQASKEDMAEMWGKDAGEVSVRFVPNHYDKPILQSTVIQSGDDGCCLNEMS